LGYLEGSKRFFFEKKKQKTFVRLVRGRGRLPAKRFWIATPPRGSQ